MPSQMAALGGGQILSKNKNKVSSQHLYGNNDDSVPID